METIYGATYYAAWGEDPDSPSVRRIKHALLEAVLHRTMPPPGRYLDVGCAFGHMLESAREHGYDPYGIELNPASARVAAQRFPGRIHEGTIETAPWPDGTFHWITAIDVLEHVPDPAGFLLSLRRFLAPDGRAAIVTPDIESASARLLGPRWPHMNAEHLCLFSSRHLTALAQRAGLAILGRCALPKPTTLSYLASEARAHPSGLPTRLVQWAEAIAPTTIVGRLFPLPMGEIIVVLAPARGRPSTC